MAISGKFRCLFCEKRLKDIGHWLRHGIRCSKVSKYIINENSCRLCKTTYSDIRSHMHAAHSDLFDEEGSKKCSHCQKDCKSSNEVTAHEVSCAFFEKYLQGQKCLLCDKSYVRLRPHFLSVHGKIFKRHVRKYLSGLKDQDNEHENVNENCEPTHSILSSFECNVCYESFEKEIELVEHKKKHDIINNILGYDSQSSSVIIEDEEKEAIKVEPIKNEECEERESYHPDEVTKLYKCPLCHSKWVHLEQTQNHIFQFHRIPVEMQSANGIRIEEILV